MIDDGSLGPHGFEDMVLTEGELQIVDRGEMKHRYPKESQWSSALKRSSSGFPRSGRHQQQNIIRDADADGVRASQERP